MKRLYAALLLCLAASAQAVSLPATVRQELNKANIPQSSIAVEVREVGRHAPLISINSQRAMNPASTMKLLTTYAALDLLGPAYTWKTEAWIDGELKDGVLNGNLILKGYGDPKFTIEQFWLWLSELRARGLREIRGDLVLDRSYFELPEYDSAVFDNDPVRAYNVGPDALLINFNTLRLRYMPDGTSLKVVSEPPLDGITLDNQLLPNAEKTNCDNWDDSFLVQPNGDSVVLQGDYPMECGEREQNLSVMPHTRYVGALFRAVWKELGGTLQGKEHDGLVSSNAKLFSTHRSEPLSSVIRDINKFSNNVMARQLFLTLGQTGPVLDEPTSSTTPGTGESLLPDNPLGTIEHTDSFVVSQWFSPPAGMSMSIHEQPFDRLWVNGTVSNAQSGFNTHPLNIERSIFTMQIWLARNRLNFKEVVLENGAGLSRKERISAAHMAELLQNAFSHPLSAELQASLPILGIDGSVKKRLKESPAAGHAHLKTGTLEGVKTLAGYVKSKSGKEWIVVFFINHAFAKRGQDAQDALIEWVQKR